MRRRYSKPMRLRTRDSVMYADYQERKAINWLNRHLPEGAAVFFKDGELPWHDKEELWDPEVMEAELAAAPIEFERMDGEELADRLSSIDAEVLALTGDGLSLRDIAKILGVSHIAVRKRLERARRHAKALLSDQQPEGPAA